MHRPKCPHCQDRSDHWEHHLLCPHPSRRDRVQEVIDKFLLKARQLTTAPDLYQQIRYGIATWLTQLDDHPIETRPELENPSQMAIGWSQFIRGYWSTEWVKKQQAFYEFTQTHDKVTTGLTWATTLLKVLWEEIHKLWLHYTSEDHPDDTDPLYKKELQNKIRKLQQQHQQEIPHDDFSFHLSPVDFHLASTNRLQNWLHLYEDILPTKIYLYTKNLSLQQPDILGAIKQIQNFAAV